MKNLIFFIFCLITFISSQCVAQDIELPGAEKNFKKWQINPGVKSQFSLIKKAYKGEDALLINPGGKIFAIHTANFDIKNKIYLDKTYKVITNVKCEGIQEGIFVLSMYCNDEFGKPIKRNVLYVLNKRSKQQGWQKIEIKIGADTFIDIAEFTESIRFQISFEGPNNICKGKVYVYGFKIEDCKEKTTSTDKSKKTE